MMRPAKKKGTPAAALLAGGLNRAMFETGYCACGHVLDYSTDETCRHCARSPQERLERLARAGHDEACRCNACLAARAL